MDAKHELFKNFAELEACLVFIEENKQASEDIRRICSRREPGAGGYLRPFLGLTIG